MRNVTLVIIVSFTMLLIGCATTNVVDLSLTEVERPTDIQERYGNAKIITIKGDTLKYQFEDDMIKTSWTITLYGITLILENKTNHSIKINWDEGVFISTDGRSHRIIHTGIRYLESASAQPPTIIAKKSYVIETIFPSSYIYYSSSSQDWIEKPLLSNNDEGKYIQILLPLQIENTINDYIFKFKVNVAKQGNKKIKN